MKFALKKSLCILLSALLSASLFAACSQDTDESSSADESSSSQVVETMVKIQIPASFFEGSSLEEIEKTAKKQGATSVTQEKNGDICYQMTATAHRRLVTEMRMNLKDSVEELLDDERYPSIHQISVSDDFSTLTLTVDKEAYQKGNDRTITRAIWPSIQLYHYFNQDYEEHPSMMVKVLNKEDNSKVEEFEWPEPEEESKTE